MTERMVSVLRVLAENDRRTMTPNEIGSEVAGHLPPVTAAGHMSGRGSGHRIFGPAQRVIFTLNRLRELGYVDFMGRPDGRSGTAYFITPEGEAALADALVAD
jgi:hypothetical protein